MRFIPIDRVKPGMVLAQSIFDDSACVLLGAYVELTKEYIEKPYYPDTQYHIKMEKYLAQFVHHTKAYGTTYDFKGKEVKEFWTVEVQKPYGKYNTGW